MGCQISYGFMPSKPWQLWGPNGPQDVSNVSFLGCGSKVNIVAKQASIVCNQSTIQTVHSWAHVKCRIGYCKWRLWPRTVHDKAFFNRASGLYPVPFQEKANLLTWRGAPTPTTRTSPAQAAFSCRHNKLILYNINKHKQNKFQFCHVRHIWVLR